MTDEDDIEVPEVPRRLKLPDEAEYEEQPDEAEYEEQPEFGAEISVTVFGQEVTVVGRPNDDLDLVSEVWDEKFEKMQKAYHEMSDDGPRRGSR